MEVIIASSASVLLRKSVTPNWRALSSASDPHAVRIITAALASMVRIWRSTSIPFISGMRRSSKVTCGRC